MNFLHFFSLLAYSSGFYLDNGVDQTMRERVLSRKEQQEMQNEILNLLGLPRRPQETKHYSNHSHKIDKKGSAPKFLLDVYRSLLDEQETKKKTKSEFELSGEDLHAIHESDVIMSFVSHSKYCSILTLLIPSK
jgi:bone morphogenetic protein 7